MFPYSQPELFELSSRFQRHTRFAGTVRMLDKGQQRGSLFSLNYANQIETLPAQVCCRGLGLDNPELHQKRRNSPIDVVLVPRTFSS